MEFSQFYNAPLYLNPAFAGVGLGPRFVLNYRNEWPSLGNAFINYAASYDQEIPKVGGIGILATVDNQGDGLYKTVSFSGVYAYQINVSDNLALKMGLSASFNQESVSLSNFVYADEIDPITGAISNSTTEKVPDFTSKSYFDAGAGLLLYSSKLFFGVSAKHITQPNLSFYQTSESNLPIRVAVNFGYEFKKKKRSKSYFTPNILYVRQANFSELNVGAYFGIGPLIGGLALRNDFTNSDAVILSVGVKQGIFKATYSYDITNSALGGKSGGAHELSLIFNAADNRHAERKRNLKKYTECPNIF